MKKVSKSKASVKIDPYLEGFMSKLLDKFASLERKVDMIISQTAGKKEHSHQATHQVQTPQPPPRRERQLYEAICADCSKVCEVPFRPSEDRAVYCKTCFAKRKAGALPHGMPKLVAVTLPPKPVGKLAQPVQTPAPSASKKAKKSPAKKKNKAKR